MTFTSPWFIAYSGGWMLASCPLTVAAVLWVVSRSTGGNEMWWLLGLPIGMVGGGLVARGTWSFATLHRCLLVGGPALLLLGIVLAVSMFGAVANARGTDVFLPGFGEFLLGIAASAVAVVGAGLWIAGFSGRRLGVAASTDDVVGS